MIGNKIGRLSVKYEAGQNYYFNKKLNKREKGNRLYYCECECGNWLIVSNSNLKKVKSCGCYRAEFTKTIASFRKSHNGGRKKTHGKTNTVEYKAWQRMKTDCYNINSKSYNHYGGRGIIVCDRWLESFINFYNDIGDKPINKHSLDRINNDGNYEKSNCRWATAKEQRNNQRRNT